MARLIARLLLWIPAVVMLVACGSAMDQAEAPSSTAGTEITPPATAQSGIVEGDDGPVAAEEETTGQPDQPVPDCLGTSGLLVVTGADGAVTVIDPDGTDPRQLRGPVRPGHPGLQPTWSPICSDGRRLIAWTEVEEDGTFVIALADITTGEVGRHPSPVAPFYYYWSPDANRLAFLGQNPFAPLQMGMLSMPTAEVEIVDEGQPFYFDWHEESDAIVAHVGENLVFFALRGGSWSSRRIPLTPGLFQAPAWVSRERFLVVVTDSPGMVEVDWEGKTAQGDPMAQRLITSDLGGTSLQNLADLEGAAAFTPDPMGRQVAVTDFDGPLRVLDLDQGVSVALSERRVAAFQWSPDGGRLLFMEVDSEARVLAPRVWDGNRTMAFPSFIPTQVFLRQYLPFWDQYSRSLSLWSPDSLAFTYPAAAPGRDRIMVQQLDARGPTEVAEGAFASWSPSGP